MKNNLMVLVVIMVSFIGNTVKETEAATLGFADIVLDYFDSGAGPLVGPYGGTWNGTV